MIFSKDSSGGLSPSNMESYKTSAVEIKHSNLASKSGLAARSTRPSLYQQKKGYNFTER
jgi:hypothetical protein